MTHEYRFAVYDEEYKYPQGFDDAPEDELDNWDEDWDEEDDYAPPSAPFNDYEDEDRP